MTNNCPICGANIALVGKSHRCREIVLPATKTSIPKKDIKAAVKEVMPNTDTSGAGATYRYRDPDKWRSYMKEYMRKKRVKK